MTSQPTARDPSQTRQSAKAYQSIPGDGYFRYMVLNPGKGDAPLTATLHVCQLKKAPSFEAISYVWGSDINDHSILCNGDVVEITSNLREALRRFRLPTKSRTLWADSVCINQEDTDGVEKSHQVALMGGIYKKADRVLIHLGEDKNGNAQKASVFIMELERTISATMKKAKPLFDSFPYLLPDERERLLQDERWNSMMALFNNPWFSRGWVVQEAGLSKTAIIWWGGTQISWQSLMIVWLWVARRLIEISFRFGTQKMSELHPMVYESRYATETIKLRDVLASTKLSLPFILDRARILGFKNDSDRVYAFLSFAKEAKITLQLTPDYKAPFTAVYTEFAKKYLESAKDLVLLHYIQHTKLTLESNIPSWVPRWDISIYRQITAAPNAEKIKGRKFTTSNNHPVVSADGKLRTRGIILDHVSDLTAVLSDVSIDEIAAVWRIASSPGTLSAYPPSQEGMAFIHAITLFRVWDQWEHWKESANIYLRHLTGDTPTSPQHLERVTDFHEHVRSCVDNRHFILTKGGHCGLAPLCTEKNDACTVIAGSLTPFILRETEKPGHYKVIGDIAIPSKFLGYNTTGRLFPSLQDRILLQFGNKSGRLWIEYGKDEQDIILC